MGVIFGLEAARALGGGIDVAAWFDEEGWFGGFPGSRSFCGLLPEAEIDTMKRRGDNVPLRAALEQAGWGGRKRIQANPARYLGYLEAHIEQGAELELTGDRIGIVTAIVGSHRFRIAFEGVQNHAGTTRMARRKDAGVALARLAVAINDRFPALVNQRTVWTTGQITVEPGSPSIVPGKAEMVFQFRDTDPEILARLGRELTLLVEEARLGPCKVSLITTGTTSPAAMDARFQGAFEASAAKHAPGKFQLMPSGAGHDAQILSTIMPAGMLFVPSIGGISHHYAEDTSDADLVLGCQVFVDAAAALLEG
jgi:N-carbamoyl-L-amino-acid hydrolase